MRTTDLRNVLRGVCTLHISTRLLAALHTDSIRPPEDEDATGVPSFAVLRTEEAKAHGMAALEQSPVAGRLSWQ